MSTDPAPWLLDFTSSIVGGPLGDGRPWGDGTAMAGRARSAPPTPPYDGGCMVTPLLGGAAAMGAMRDALEAVITAARQNKRPVVSGALTNGHVYIADWRFNTLRDLSTDTPWPSPVQPVARDQTAIGLVLRLMQAGVKVRVLLWNPTSVTTLAPGSTMATHIEDHHYLARVVAAENQRLKPLFGLEGTREAVGIVALDMRVTDSRVTATHHQKMMVIRTPALDKAFCGGVDLAFTRRDATPAGSDFKAGAGDWQSGDKLPKFAGGWPRQASPDGSTAVDYTSADGVRRPTHDPESDLPVGVYGANCQLWHDHHLELQGPVVQTLEEQFRERWIDAGEALILDPAKAHRTHDNSVLFSSSEAVGAAGGIVSLEQSRPAAPAGKSIVQMWRTIPLRTSRTTSPFRRGEFTVLAGIAKVASAATELIWICDQYFWSVPLARLLHRRLGEALSLRVIVILPPHSDYGPSTDAAPKAQHMARAEAIAELLGAGGDSVADRVGIYSMWVNNPAAGPSRGVYVHAKTHTYDDRLLVCGSANLNRRSFLCDSEIACAVVDPDVVLAHQRALWQRLLPQSPWPNLGTTAGWGAAFFAKFRDATGVTKPGVLGPSHLMLDPWDRDCVLPNSAQRKRMDGSPWYESWRDRALDPSSVIDAVQDPVLDASTGQLRNVDLVDVTRALEEVVDKHGRFTFRQPA